MDWRNKGAIVRRVFPNKSDFQKAGKVLPVGRTDFIIKTGSYQ